MTIEVRQWANNASGNNTGGGLFIEGIQATDLTDSLRTMQASLRKAFNQLAWFSVGDLNGPASFAFLSSTSFRVVGIELAAQYHVGRRVRALGNATGDIRGSITAVSASGGNTDVTVDWDTANELVSESLQIELASSQAVGSDVPAIIDHPVEVQGNLETTGNLITPSGPFRLVNIVKASSGSVAIPATTKQLQIDAYGAGGGGGSAGTNFGTDPSRGFDGSNFNITASGFSMSISGGRGGGASGNTEDGQMTSEPSTSTITGASFSFTRANGGNEGGFPSVYATKGSNGSFGRAVVLNPGFTSLTVAAAAGGSRGAGQAGQNGVGSDGAAAEVVVYFYE